MKSFGHAGCGKHWDATNVSSSYHAHFGRGITWLHKFQPFSLWRIAHSIMENRVLRRFYIFLVALDVDSNIYTATYRNGGSQQW